MEAVEVTSEVLNIVNPVLEYVGKMKSYRGRSISLHDDLATSPALPLERCPSIYFLEQAPVNTGIVYTDFCSGEMRVWFIELGRDVGPGDCSIEWQRARVLGVIIICQISESTVLFQGIRAPYGLSGTNLERTQELPMLREGKGWEGG